MAGKDRTGKAERRSSERTALKIPVDYSAVDAFFSEFSANINEGGIFIETETPAPLDEVVQLQFRVPQLAEPIQLEGRVAWISDGKGESPPGMGIEFQAMTPEVKTQIDALVRTLRSQG